MRDLGLWELYSREEVHDLFSPHTSYTPGSGGWGIAGIVRLPDTARSYVFLVTIGTHQSGHDFEESITDEGVLSWQSQPQQKLSFPTIQKLIEHDSLTDTIHLFLRLNAKDRYRYYGELGYLEHDEDREQPVYFKWQLLTWPPPSEVLDHLEPILESTADVSVHQSAPVERAAPRGLSEVDPPAGAKTGGSSTRAFQAKTLALHPDQDARNKRLGLAGEKLVVHHERQRLGEAGFSGLASQVVHVSEALGDGAGYDILSFAENGEPRHIEVKTTRGGLGTGFFVSPNEVAFSEQNPDTFVLVRVFRYDSKTGSALFYEQPGSLSKVFDLTPSQYRATLRP